MMRYLLFASILLLAGCATETKLSTTKTDNCLLSAAPDLKNELYRASVDVYDHHISGLMFFKTMPDSSKNVVFTTETGVTFFNFAWSKSGKFEVKYVLKKLDRKVIINLLRKDFELIIVPESYRVKATREGDGTHAVQLKKETAYFTTSEDCSFIEKAEVRHGDQLKTRINFFPAKKNIPDSVYIEHLNFNMKLAFGRIVRDHVTE